MQNLRFEEVNNSYLKAYNFKNEEVFNFQHFADDNYVQYTWLGYVPIEQAKEIYAVVSRFVSKNQIPFPKSLTDMRKAEGSYDEMNEWLAKEFMPVVIKYGLKAYASVFPEDFYSQLATEEYIALAQDLPCQKAYFQADEMDKAIEWIKQVDISQ
ncbi:MAG: hypothetical protein MUE85_04350 [Microscillaceae bacterium]|jgi:hypothetical protein|nr:hypothetical protein [Microscillaceae bacterium]